MDTRKEDGAAFLGPCSGLPQGICKEGFHTAGLSDLDFYQALGSQLWDLPKIPLKPWAVGGQTPLEVPALPSRQEQGPREGGPC